MRRCILTLDLLAPPLKLLGDVRQSRILDPFVIPLALLLFAPIAPPFELLGDVCQSRILDPLVIPLALLLPLLLLLTFSL